MSKSLNIFDKITDGTKVHYNAEPANEYIKYLNNYNTENADTVYRNLADWAARASQNLEKMGNYTFRVDDPLNSLEDTKQATFENTLAQILPYYEAQKNTLHTKLLNQGLGVDTQAYQKAMANLESAQDNAINQAAFDSLEKGQNAYTTDLNNKITAAQFSNAAQQDYINQLISALEGNLSGYNVANEKYTVGNNLSNALADAQNQSIQNKLKIFTKAMESLAKVSNGHR